MGPLTHIEALDLDQVPKHLLVLGAGYVGLELAQAFRRFGAEVTLIDRNSRLAHHEDDDISQGLEEMCRDEGFNVVTNTIVTRVKGKSGGSIRLLGTRDGVELSPQGTHLLVAGGRTDLDRFATHRIQAVSRFIRKKKGRLGNQRVSDREKLFVTAAQASGSF